MWWWRGRKWASVQIASYNYAQHVFSCKSPEKKISSCSQIILIFFLHSSYFSFMEFGILTCMLTLSLSLYFTHLYAISYYQIIFIQTFFIITLQLYNNFTCFKLLHIHIFLAYLSTTHNTIDFFSCKNASQALKKTLKVNFDHDKCSLIIIIITMMMIHIP